MFCFRFCFFFPPFVLFKKKVHKLKTELFFFAGSVPLLCSLRLQTGVQRWWQRGEGGGGKSRRSEWKAWMLGRGMGRGQRSPAESENGTGRRTPILLLQPGVLGAGEREEGAERMDGLRGGRERTAWRGLGGGWGDPHFRCFSSLSPLLVLLSVWLLGLLLRYILSMALSASVR